MLDIPGQPVLDKDAMIGGCSRLPLKVESDRLQREVAALPDASWGSAGGRVGVHKVAEALFLRGYAPVEGERPIEDRPALNLLPHARYILEQLVPGIPMRCLIARLPAGAVVAPHIDRAPYFAKTVRIHVPIETNDAVHMVASGLCYAMRAGEVWALNNSAPHAVWNAHASSSRTHMICDFLPDEALRALLAKGERHLGVRRADVEAHVVNAREAVTAAR